MSPGNSTRRRIYMWKKVFGLAAGMLAVVLLITGVMTAVNADSVVTGAAAPSGVPGGPPPGPHMGRGFGPALGSDIMDKLAARLKIDKATLESAFKQVMLEEQQARTNDMFASWVRDGKLTQVQADAYKTWQAARPDGVPRFPFFDSAKATAMLEKLHADSKVTDEQYEACKAWIAQKPDVELPRPERPAGVGAPPCGGPGPLQ